MLTQCCCGCSLRTGCFILAYLNFISIAFSVINLLVQVNNYDVPSGTLAGWVCYILLNLIVGSFFAYGVHKENWHVIVPYVILSGLGVVAGTIAFLVLTFVIHPLFLLGLLFCALAAYFTAVVLSYVAELKSGIRDNQPRIVIQQVVAPQPGTVYVQVPVQQFPEMPIAHSPPPTYDTSIKQ